MESIRLAERIGSNAAEVDVRLTRDGIPILFHDPGLSKALVQGLFCNGQVKDLSLAELRGSCLLRYGEVIPTVEESLAMMIEETELEGVYLDVKVPEAMLPTARIVSRVLSDLQARNTNDDPNDDRVFVPLLAIVSEEGLAAWHETEEILAGEGSIVPECLLEYDPELVISEGCRSWGPTWTKGPRADDVQKVRDAGASTIFWTINQTDFIDQFLIQAQPNGIISARAALLFHRYQQIGTPPPVQERKP
jgi:glycerophosphoryl diester phosphodiesterase